MTVRTYYGDERVSVPGPNGERLVGTVSGVAGGRVVVALDEPSEAFPAGWEDVDGTGESRIIPGQIAQILERDLEFFVDGSEASAPSFSPEQLAYLRRTYGEAAGSIAGSEEAAQSNAATTLDEGFSDDEPSEDELRAAAAAQAASSGTGLSPQEIANARVPADGAGE